MKWWRFIAGCVLLTTLTVVAVVKFGSWEVARLEARVHELERERQRLADYAARLSASRRVAQLTILSQTADEAGVTNTTLRFQEIGADGLAGTPIEACVRGTQLYVEAMVLKFEHRLVGDASPQEPVVSLALFRRLFGDRQSPETGVQIGRDARPPAANSTGGSVSLAERERLWEKFWTLTEDATLARRLGVRVAQCEAPSVRVRTGEVWETTLDAAGGLNLRRISAQ